jgi:hypothetical protein
VLHPKTSKQQISLTQAPSLFFPEQAIRGGQATRWRVRSPLLAHGRLGGRRGSQAAARRPQPGWRHAPLAWRRCSSLRLGWRHASPALAVRGRPGAAAPCRTGQARAACLTAALPAASPARVRRSTPLAGRRHARTVHPHRRPAIRYQRHRAGSPCVLAAAPRRGRPRGARSRPGAAAPRPGARGRLGGRPDVGACGGGGRWLPPPSPSCSCSVGDLASVIIRFHFALLLAPPAAPGSNPAQAEGKEARAAPRARRHGGLGGCGGASGAAGSAQSQADGERRRGRRRRRCSPARG